MHKNICKQTQCRSSYPWMDSFLSHLDCNEMPIDQVNTALKTLGCLALWKTWWHMNSEDLQYAHVAEQVTSLESGHSLNILKPKVPRLEDIDTPKNKHVSYVWREKNCRFVKKIVLWLHGLSHSEHRTTSPNHLFAVDCMVTVLCEWTQGVRSRSELRSGLLFALCHTLIHICDTQKGFFNCSWMGQGLHVPRVISPAG